MIRKCEREQRLLDAGRRDSLTGELMEHVESCARCSAALAADRWLRNASIGSEAGEGRASATALLWRARLRREHEARVARSELTRRPTRLAGGAMAFGCHLGGIDADQIGRRGFNSPFFGAFGVDLGDDLLDLGIVFALEQFVLA